MTYFTFVDRITQNESIKVYNHGKMMRDFTYIDGWRRCIDDVYRNQVSGGGQSGKQQASTAHGLASVDRKALMDHLGMQ